MTKRSSHYNSLLTLPDLLKRAAAGNGDELIGFLDENGRSDTISYSGLLAEASVIAIGLQNAGVTKGDKLIIATARNKETMTLLWAAFLIGAVPTILQPPPTFSGYNPPVVKLLNVSEQLNAPFIFMSSVPQTEASAGLKFMTTESLNCQGILKHPDIDPSSVAFIQFSSGSTGDPKGIMLSHYNIIVNLDAINVGLDIHPGDVIGNWMPLFHDMGLIGYHLAATYTALEQWHLETIDFIKNPGLWLNMLSDKKVKVTGCPNFGLSLTLRYIKRLKSKPAWDFSYLKALLNGAEPISVQIMDDFINDLAEYNFKPEAMMPVYGLAEATLAATFTPIMQPSIITAFDSLMLDRDGCAVVITDDVKRSDSDQQSGGHNVRLITGVGMPLNDIEIMVTDHDYNPLPEGHAGLINIKGDSVTSGYYNKPDETRQVFHNGWFNTGDIGFLYKGSYYISGREKDIIFRNGRHYFANDLEELACTVEGVTYGKICFAGTTNHHTGQEEVVAFLSGSPGDKARETFSQLRNLLRSTVGITLDELVMVRSNDFPKTSSGKLQRYKLIQRYLAGEFNNSLIN